MGNATAITISGIIIDDEHSADRSRALHIHARR